MPGIIVRYMDRKADPGPECLLEFHVDDPLGIVRLWDIGVGVNAGHQGITPMLREVRWAAATVNGHPFTHIEISRQEDE